MSSTNAHARFLSFEDQLGAHDIRLLARNRVGRGITSTITLERPGVSARHAIVLVDPQGHVELADDRSENGTWVNGRRVSRCRLHAGDELTIGKRSDDAPLGAPPQALPRHFESSSEVQHSAWLP